MAERVYWNDEEKRKLVDAVFVMRQNDPDSSLISIINRAQKQFPKDRQRNIPSVKVIPWLSDEVKARFKEQREKVRALDNAKTEASTAKQNQTDLKAKLNKLVDDARTDAIKKTSTEDLLIEVIARLELNQQEVNKRLAVLERKFDKPLAPAAPAPEPKKLPSFLVVGLLPQQQGIIAARFRGRAKLQFMDGDDANRKMPQADYAILNSRWVKHKAQERLTSGFRGSVHLVNGGLGTIGDRIEELL
jgi:hypothetical protein